MNESSKAEAIILRTINFRNVYATRSKTKHLKPNDNEVRDNTIAKEIKLQLQHLAATFLDTGGPSLYIIVSSTILTLLAAAAIGL